MAICTVENWWMLVDMVGWLQVRIATKLGKVETVDDNLEEGRGK
jgi:hypothetical protein